MVCLRRYPMPLELHNLFQSLSTPMALALSLTRKYWPESWRNLISAQVRHEPLVLGHSSICLSETSNLQDSLHGSGLIFVFNLFSQRLFAEESLFPGLMARNLDLYKPRYLKTAAYGHFGRDGPEFTWEKVVKL